MLRFFKNSKPKPISWVAIKLYKQVNYGDAKMIDVVSITQYLNDKIFNYGNDLKDCEFNYKKPYKKIDTLVKHMQNAKEVVQIYLSYKSDSEMCSPSITICNMILNSSKKTEPSVIDVFEVEMVIPIEQYSVDIANEFVKEYGEKFSFDFGYVYKFSEDYTSSGSKIKHGLFSSSISFDETTHEKSRQLANGIFLTDFAIIYENINFKCNIQNIDKYNKNNLTDSIRYYEFRDEK